MTEPISAMERFSASSLVSRVASVTTPYNSTDSVQLGLSPCADTLRRDGYLEDAVRLGAEQGVGLGHVGELNVVGEQGR